MHADSLQGPSDAITGFVGNKRRSGCQENTGTSRTLIINVFRQLNLYHLKLCSPEKVRPGSGREAGLGHEAQQNPGSSGQDYLVNLELFVTIRQHKQTGGDTALFTKVHQRAQIPLCIPLTNWQTFPVMSCRSIDIT